MRQFTNTRGRIEIGLAVLMLIVSGSLLPSGSIENRSVSAAAPYDTSYSAGFSCKGYDTCPSSGFVKLKFSPLPNSHTVRWQDILSASTPGATKIGTVTNVDGVRFPPLDLAPGATAGIFIGQIGADPAKDRGFGIYKLNNAGQRIGSAWLPNPADQITYCEPPTPTPNPGGRSKAAIHARDTGHEMGWNCGPIMPAAQSSSTNHRTSLASASRSLQIGRLWISCSGGCCDIGGM